MKTNETIYETYSKKVCSICKNKKTCQEELRTRLDGSIKCDKYETTFKRKPIDAIMYSTKW